MKFILTLIAVGVFGFLSGCNNAAAPKPGDATKSNAANTTNTTANTTKPTNANPAQKVDAHGHVDNAERITLADAKKEFDAGNVVFLDTRDDASFKQEHIKGALNIPLNKLAERINDIPKGKKIIAYCS
jgi:predicted sulfurtransferase